MKAYTVRFSSEGLYKEKGSKFISYLLPIHSEDEVKERLSVLRSEHHKARHFCYAFKLGGSLYVERSNDDGEPNGSAGLPILNQLRSAKLINVLLVVVRYFGGTKLGVGGLNRAYKISAKDAIDSAEIIENIEHNCVNIQFAYDEMGKVKKMIERQDWKLKEAKYEDPCFFTICSSVNSEEVMKRILLNERTPSLKIL